MRIVLSGKTAHASMPEFGVSPMPAMAALMPALTALGGGGPLDEGFAMLTVTRVARRARLRGRAGTGRDLDDPADAHRFAHGRTAGTGRNPRQADRGRDRPRPRDHLSRHLPPLRKRPRTGAQLRRALEAEEIPFDRGLLPMRASEDFGHFSARAPVGFTCSARANATRASQSDYDFPDDLIAIGAGVFMRVLRNSLG